MSKKSTTSGKSTSWLVDEQLPLDSFFRTKASTSTSTSQVTRTEDKGKRRKSSRHGAGTPARRPKKQRAVEVDAEENERTISKSKGKERVVLEDITDEENGQAGHKTGSSLPTPASTRRKHYSSMVAKDGIEFSESSDGVQLDPDPVFELTPSKPPTFRPTTKASPRKDSSLPTLSASCKTASGGAPPISPDARMCASAGVPEPDNSLTVSKGACGATPCRPPANKTHAGDTLPSPPASSLPSRIHPAAPRTSDSTTPLPQAPLTRLRFMHGAPLKTPVASTAVTSYPTPESIAVPRLAFPVFRQSHRTSDDSRLMLPPSSPNDSDYHRFYRSSSPPSGRNETRLDSDSAPAFPRPSTPNSGWEIQSSQSQHPIYSPRKMRKPAPLFIEGSSSCKLDQTGRDSTVPTSQEDEDEMTLEKALLSKSAIASSNDCLEQIDRLNHSSALPDQSEVSVISHDRRLAIISPAPDQTLTVKIEDQQCFDKSVISPQHDASKACPAVAFDGSSRSRGTCDMKGTGATHANDEDQRHIILGEPSQPLDPDVHSSMTIEESWAENPFPSLKDSVLKSESVNSAYRCEPNCTAPALLHLNAKASCTQSSETQMDSDDEDPFPSLSVPTTTSTSTEAIRNLALIPHHQGHGDSATRYRATSIEHVMPEVGSADDTFSILNLTTQDLPSVLRDVVRSSRRTASSTEGSALVIRDYLNIFERDMPSP